MLDDDDMVSRSVARMLAPTGHDVTVEADPTTALERVRGELFDLVICDLQMPTMYGTVFIENVRALLGKEAPVMVLLTGYDRIAECAVAESSADKLVIKPVSSSQLARIVASTRELKARRTFEAT